MPPDSPNSSHPGLSHAEAAERLAREGPNELPQGGYRSLLNFIAGVLQEPMLLLLLAAGAIYLLLGDLDDALILLAFVLLTIGIAMVQEVRTGRAIEALRELSMPQAIVIRDGHRVSISSRDVVRGDLLVIEEGSRIAADGWIVQANDLRADEALLTGESVAVSKSALDGTTAGTGNPPYPGGDHLPYAFSGTLAVRGTGLMQVVATGANSQIGQIGQSLATLETETPRLVRQTRGLVRLIAIAGLLVSALAVLLYGFLRGDWLAALLSGVALAMSLLPEELPIILALFMTIGALRMSRSRVLARSGTAIETLGAATVLCTDKTGTLTQNVMAIVELRLPGGETFRLNAGASLLKREFADIARLGMLASEEQPFDPMEKAFHELANNHSAETPSGGELAGWTVEQKYALAPELLAVSQVWAREGRPERLVAAKGAPETIADLCDLDDEQRKDMHASLEEMAQRGLRVLAIAEARWEAEGLPASQRQFDFVYRGLAGLADPIRATVPAAVSELREAGIRVMMITGDYPATARAIALQAGIAAGRVMTGEELSRIDDAELASQIANVAVFARVMPQEKLRIVRALKAAGEVVAMTGDGVNDAPSLKAAHIGIAMSHRGTDVARETSSIVLLDDDFGAIVAAVRLGRRIYDNIRKATAFIFAVHLPIAGLAIAPLLTGWPLILGPVHIALLEMVIDPVCSLAFEAEPEESDVMRRKPRAPESPLISRNLVAWSVLQGAATVILLLALATWANLTLAQDQLVRATCYAGLIAAVLILVLANRSFRSGKGSLEPTGRNWTLILVLLVTVGSNVLVLLVPQVASLFHFVTLGAESMIAVTFCSAALAVLLTLAKPRFRGGFSR